MVQTQLVTGLSGRQLSLWQGLMARAGLVPDGDSDQTVLVWEGEALLAAGSRKGDLLKCIAVDPLHQGEDLAATVLTALRQAAFQAGFRHLFLYTKPANEELFRGLFFYPVVKTREVLLMENVQGGIQKFLHALPLQPGEGAVGAAVMNCDPFTLGHLHLVETAARQCSRLYLFVLSEERGYFSASDRLAMVRAGTAHLPNVSVLPTGPYLISGATFPTYFLKDRERAPQVHCGLDIAIFTRYFVPRFSISHRFVGEEPLSPMTGRYNAALAQSLPQAGVELHILPRFCVAGVPVSASTVRARLRAGMDVRELVPETTRLYLQNLSFV